MPSNTEITVSQLSRLVGIPGAPIVVDVRTDQEFAADPRLVPGAKHRDFETVASWAGALAGQQVVVCCQRGLDLSEGVAARLRSLGIPADVLKGGFEAWRDGDGLLVATANLPVASQDGHTIWVTRARPKVDRLACPWLIRRFIDRDAAFLFVAASEVMAVAKRFGAMPFDMDGGFWSHRDCRCTFDTMIEEFGLKSPALDKLAVIVRGADTARLDLAPQAAGFLAVSLGLSRMFRDDLAQLDAGMLLYDAMYRWCRDADQETHDWPSAGKPS